MVIMVMVMVKVMVLNSAYTPVPYFTSVMVMVRISYRLVSMPDTTRAELKVCAPHPAQHVPRDRPRCHRRTRSGARACDYG